MIRIEPKTPGRRPANALGLAALLLVLLALPACMAPPRADIVASPVQTGKPVSLDNVLVTTTNAAGGLDAERQLLASSLVSGLRQTGMFAGVGRNPSDLGPGDGIRLQAEITSVRQVTDNARDWVGPLAGRARIEVRVNVADLRSGHPIETFAVAGQSGQSSYGGTTAEAVQMAAQKIVAEMLRFNAQAD